MDRYHFSLEPIPFSPTNQRNVASAGLGTLAEAFWNGRGNSENFIREVKYGYDLKHFPCLQLRANHAYGLLGLIAHNMLRWMAIHDDHNHPKFSKAIRRKFIHIPAKLGGHARTLVLKVSAAALKEVNRLREALELTPYPPIPVGLASG